MAGVDPSEVGDVNRYKGVVLADPNDPRAYATDIGPEQFVRPLEGYRDDPPNVRLAE